MLLCKIFYLPLHYNNKTMIMEYFKSIEDLITYSNERTSIRFNGNQRLHRASKGTLGNCIAKNDPNGESKIKNLEVYYETSKEREFRIIISKMRLPISTKII